MYRVERQFFSV